jgi:hypothetical protein
VNPVRVALIAAALAVLDPRRAAAQDASGAGARFEEATYPYGDLVRQPLTLPRGTVQLDLPITVNLTRGAVGEPWAVPAAATYGLSDDLAIGLVHARGLCLSGRGGGCPRVYDDAGGRLRVSLLRAGGGQLAAEGTLLASRFDDPLFDGLAGLVYKHTLGSFAGIARLDLSLALSGRARRLYREVLAGSIEGQYRLADGLAGFARVGLAKALEVRPPFEIATAIPAGLGVQVAPARRLEVGGELRFPDLLGSAGGTDEREGILFARVFL